jgi:hypothetical protein
MKKAPSGGGSCDCAEAVVTERAKANVIAQTTEIIFRFKVSPSLRLPEFNRPHCRFFWLSSQQPQALFLWSP